jgi:hypothetical protein
MIVTFAASDAASAQTTQSHHKGAGRLSHND